MIYHVSKSGKNLNPGTAEQPFLTISKAAYVALPGDTIVVHEGVYREWVSPKSGGTAAKRITYKAADGEKVTITGAEVITDWVEENGVHKAVVDNSFFGRFNPFEQKMYGDWFFTRDKVFHLGEVYLDGKSMYEVDSLDLVKNPVRSERSFDADFSLHTWHAEVGETTTTIYANFQGADPTGGKVEINVRKFCFWPEKPGVSYITVDGFTMKQAATQWAPPTALQEGLIGPHWSKGWIIENNTISESRNSGISLGKEEATGENEWTNMQFKFGHQREQEVIFRAVNNGWNKDNIGGHIVRNNVIFDCGQTGIVGHLGCAFSTIENNHIYNIRKKREYEGAEVGGIKLHAAIDTVIRNNIIHDSFRGVWLDWQAQGTHVCNNVMFGNDSEDILVEVSHGPTMIDHNLLLSRFSFKTIGHSSALVHNLVAGIICTGTEMNRNTPYHVPHSTSVAGMNRFVGGDDRYYNNVFLRDKNDTDDEPYLADFWGGRRLNKEDVNPRAQTFTAYPVGTAVYNNCPGPDDEKPWIAMQRFFAAMSRPKPKEEPKVEPNADDKKPDDKPYASLSGPQPHAVYIENNVYFNRAMPYTKEKGAKVFDNTGMEFEIDRQSKKVVVTITNPDLLKNSAADIITTDILGSGFECEQLFENPDQTPYNFNVDMQGRCREGGAIPGPFQVTGQERFEFSF